MTQKTMVSLTRSPTNLHGYKCPLFIGLNYHITEFITMPLNCYSTFLEYSAASLLFAGQSCHTVSKQWASMSGRPTIAGLRPKGLAPRRRPSSPTARRSLGGSPPDGRRRSPRVSARPRGGHGSRRWPPRSGARRCLGESSPVRAEASPAGLRPAAGLRLQGRAVALESLRRSGRRHHP